MKLRDMRVRECVSLYVPGPGELRATEWSPGSAEREVIQRTVRAKTSGLPSISAMVSRGFSVC